MKHLVVLAALVIGPSTACPAMAEDETGWIDLARSPDGETRLYYQVVGERAELRSTYAGRERWRRKFALIPDLASLTDGGQAVVTGTRTGRGFERGRRQNYFVIAILDPWGQLLQYQHVMQRGSSRGRYSGGGMRRGSSRGRYPRAEGLIVDGASDIAVVRLPERRRSGAEWWWLFNLSSGELIGDLHPWDEVAPGPNGELRLRDARLVPGLRVVATLWSTGECPGSRGSNHGDTLALLQLRGGPPVIQSLAGADREPCASLEAVERDGVRLRSLGGAALLFSVSRDEAGSLELARH